MLGKLNLESQSRYPKWLLKSFEDIIDSREWNGFLGELQDTIQQQLAESHVQEFADLSDAERLLFLDKGVRALNGSPSHQVMSARISQTLDSEVNGHVARAVVRDTPFHTRTDCLAGEIHDAVVAILKRWPELRGRMTRFLNEALPEPMRHQVWRVFLSNEVVQQQYQRILQTNPRVAISPHDKVLTQRVEQMIAEEPTFSSLRGSVGAFYATKAVLSYYHAMKRTQQSLTDNELKLMVPFVMVLHSRMSKREPPSVKVMDVLVQEYFTFMKQRPSYTVDTGTAESEQDLERFSQKVMSFVSKMDPGLLQTFMDAFAPSSVEIIATEAKMNEMLGSSVVALIRPIIVPFFVGVLSPEPLLFLWDQYLIGTDSPGFHDLLLPVATACLLVLLRNDLKKGNSMASFETVLKEEGPRLRSTDFQYLINEHFYPDFFRVVSQEKGGPVLDPTQRPLDPGLGLAPHPQWKEWFSDLGVPNRTEPRDRQEYRLFKEGERQRFLELERQREAEEARRRALEERLEAVEARRRAEVAKEKEKAEKEKRVMEEELAEEKQRRVDEQLRADAEIKRLEDELAKLKRDGPRSSRSDSRPSYGSPSPSPLFVPPPPPSIATHASPVPAGAMQDLSGLSNEQRAQDAITGILRACSQAVDIGGHGSGKPRQHLDSETKRYIALHTRDLQECEEEIFGHALAPGELERMDEGNNGFYTAKLITAVEQRWIERREQEMRR